MPVRAEDLAEHREAVQAYLLRMVMHEQDAEDLTQETMRRALEKGDGFRGDAALRTWMLSIATNVALDHLRRKKRWRVEAMQISEQTCRATPSMWAQMGEFYQDPEFEFDARSHVAFCMSCIIRTRPPEEAAALMLREVYGLGSKEAARAVGVSDSVLRHRLAAARKSMRESFDGLCTLVDKKGACRQCSNFKGAPVDVLDDAEPDEHVTVRLQILAEQDWSAGATGRVHALQLRWLDQQER